MLEHPEDLDDEKIITAKNQIMFAIQIAYGLVRKLIGFHALRCLFSSCLTD